MKGLASGIEKNRNLVEKAVKDVASDMVISPKVNGMEYGYTDGAFSGGNMSDLISGAGEYCDPGICRRYAFR